MEGGTSNKDDIFGIFDIGSEFDFENLDPNDAIFKELENFPFDELVTKYAALITCEARSRQENFT
jgi:hypothetical protein